MDLPTGTVKSRIAKSLGLSRPPVGRTIPLQKAPQGKDPADRSKNTDPGMTQFSVLGHKDDLYAFQE